MEQYGKLLLIGMPVILCVVLFEKWYGWRMGKDTVRNLDMISSLSSGIISVTKDVLGLSLAIGMIYPWLAGHLALIHIPSSVLVYIIAFFAFDLTGYWAHRIQHTTNFFWNGHLIHHSSEEFNLACALRQNISPILKIFFAFLLPAALLGVPAQVIAVVVPLQLFAPFWYHTQHIGKMGFLEKIIVTPSHHRVHHAINPEYIDKNYSQVFIFWDKWFGSYQEELPDVPPVYGVTRPVQTWNPIRISFQHVWLLFNDARRTVSWKDKLRIWLMPTGWRPADVAEKYPVHKIADVYQFDKYAPRASLFLHSWSWGQLLATLLLTGYLFGNIAAIDSLDKTYIYLYGGFILLGIYAFTELMSRNPYAIVWEAVRCVLGLLFIYLQGDWFGAAAFIPNLQYIAAGYFILSLLVTVYLAMRHYREDCKVQITPLQIANIESD